MQGQQDFSFVNKRGERRTKFFTNHLLFFFFLSYWGEFLFFVTTNDVKELAVR